MSLEQQPSPRHDLIWAAIDLDGTLAEPVWSEENPHQIGKPIWENVHKLKKLDQMGYKIIIHTARGWTDYEAIEWWLDHYYIPYSRIVCGKLLASVYIDDRAISAKDEKWWTEGDEEE